MLGWLDELQEAALSAEIERSRAGADHRRPAPHVVLPTQLVVRGSTAPPPPDR